MRASACRRLAWGGILLACSGTTPEETRFERATMGEIAEALTQALPLSLSAEQLDDPAQREVFQRALLTLAQQASRLESHGRSRAATFEYLSASLARDAEEALRRFELGRPDEARFLVQELVNDCVACHSRLPSEDAPLGEMLLSRVDVSRLAPEERVRLLVASRQFDDALAGYEALFRDPAIPPAKLDLEGHLTDYLVLSVRVKQDLKRPQAPLAALARRPDTAGYLRRDLQTWVASLHALEGYPLEGPPIPQARALLEASGLEGGPGIDRSGLVYQLVASGLLHRSLDTVGDSGPEAAEAYYLLGLAETRIRHSYWLSEAEAYLEAAVRADPRSQAARNAFALLEEETLAGYSGSGGVHLPDDVRTRLEELRELVGP
jgi:hypothetical protein